MTCEDLNKLYPPPCDKCTACCCKNEHNSHCYAVELEPDELERFKDVMLMLEGDEYGVIPYDDITKTCVLLKDNKCSRYDDRPQKCRNYNCRRFLHMYDDIRKEPTPADEIYFNPKLRVILEHPDMAIPREYECRALNINYEKTKT